MTSGLDMLHATYPPIDVFHNCQEKLTILFRWFHGSSSTLEDIQWHDLRERKMFPLSKLLLEKLSLKPKNGKGPKGVLYLRVREVLMEDLIHKDDLMVVPLINQVNLNIGNQKWEKVLR